MALSDEILHARKKLSRVRGRIEELVAETGARAGFLVDEEGSPFAAVGNVEFRLPHPLAGLVGRGANPLLLALLGEPPREDSGFVVESVSVRALLVLVTEAPLSAEERARVHAAAGDIARVLDPKRRRL
jgi:hypothetical protein